jgi:membrane protein implicated in regulation of membrane protease activity
MMLRNAILAFFALLLACAAAAALAGAPTWPSAAMLALLVAAIAFERGRYQARIAGRGPMTPTAERFTDPATGRRVQVWANASGERSYVEEPGPEG